MGVSAVITPIASNSKSAPASSDFEGAQLAKEDPTPAACPDCQGPLELHQPDRNLPDRLLATCPRCLAWTLIDINDLGEMILTRLPKVPR